MAFDQQNLRAIYRRTCAFGYAGTLSKAEKAQLDLPAGGTCLLYIRLAYIDLTISGVLFLRETEYSLADVFGKDFDPIEFMSAQRSLKKSA